MRLNINLASQPYEVAREYKRRMALVIAGLAVLACVLVAYIVYQRVHSRTVNQRLADIQQQINGLDREEAQARAMLNKPANRVIADQSDFLNDLFARKALSWTHIFTEMEKIMPAEIHVMSMKPEYTKTNDLVLHVVVATNSRDRAVELVRHMEKSNHFRQAQVVAESVVANTSEQSAANGSIQFDVAAIYVPGAPDTDETPDATGDKAGDKAVDKAKEEQPKAPAPAKSAATTPPAQPAPKTNPSPNAAAAGNKPLATGPGVPKLPPGVAQNRMRPGGTLKDH